MQRAASTDWPKSVPAGRVRGSPCQLFRQIRVRRLKMGEYLDSLHEAHKVRQSRLKKAAFKAVTNPEPESESEPETVRYSTTFEIILREICTYYDVRKLDILSQRRINNITHPRHMLAYMLYRMTSFTNGQIAKNMQKDISTIAYAINKIINHIQSHQSDIDELEKRIEKLLAQRK